MIIKPCSQCGDKFADNSAWGRQDTCDTCSIKNGPVVYSSSDKQEASE